MDNPIASKKPPESNASDQHEHLSGDAETHNKVIVRIDSSDRNNSTRLMHLIVLLEAWLTTITFIRIIELQIQSNRLIPMIQVKESIILCVIESKNGSEAMDN